MSSSEATVVGAVLAAWRGVLRSDQIGPDEDFFAAGGTSLAAAGVAAELRRVLGRDTPTVGDVLRSGTARRLAAYLMKAREPTRVGGMPLGDGALCQIRAPATVQQQAIWFLEQFNPGNIAYNSIAAIELDGRVDAKRLAWAVGALVERHAILRTRFLLQGGALVQSVEARGISELEQIDMTGASSAELERKISELGRYRFDVARLPLIRWTHLQCALERFVLVQVEHHFVHDGWSTWILLTELAALYRAETGSDACLPRLAFDYETYGRWQDRWLATEEAETRCARWIAILKDAPATYLFPTDARRPSLFGHEGATTTVEFPEAMRREIHSFAVRASVTPFAVLMAAFVVFLGELGGADALTLGSTVRNRQLSGSELVAGMFVNTVALPFCGWRALCFEAFARTVLMTLTEALDGEQVPFPNVVRRLKLPRDLSRNPLFQISFSMNDWPGRRLDFGPNVVADVSFPSNGGAKFDLDIVLENPERCTFLWRYYLPLFAPEDIRMMIAQYHDVLARCIREPEVLLGEIDWVTVRSQSMIGHS